MPRPSALTTPASSKSREISVTAPSGNAAWMGTQSFLSPGLHRRCHAVVADDHPACCKCAIFTVLGDDKDSGARGKVRRTGCSDGHNRRICRDRYLLFLAVVIGEGYGSAVDGCY